MKIVLLRHGAPKIDINGLFKKKCSPNDLKGIIGAYTESGLNPLKEPTPEALRQAQWCKFVVCSDLPRSTESAIALRVSNIDMTDPMFREADLPVTGWRYPQLTVFTWGMFFRFLWFLGYSKNVEPISSARQRAEKAAIQLSELADTHGSVMLVGHGIMNRFIAKKLKTSGWRGPKDPGTNYWEYGIYEYPMT